MKHVKLFEQFILESTEEKEAKSILQDLLGEYDPWELGDMTEEEAEETVDGYGHKGSKAKKIAKILFDLASNGIFEAKMDIFPGYNNAHAPGDYKYMKEMKALLSKIKGISEYDDMDTTTHVYIKSAPGNSGIDLTKDIQKALKGFDDNLDLNNITSNIGKPGETSPNDQEKGIVTYKITKKVDWWTLKRAAGPEKPSTETVLTDEIISSILDRMAQVSTTQDQLANTAWTSLEDLLRAAEDHMSSTNYKKFYKEIKKKYPKMA